MKKWIITLALFVAFSHVRATAGFPGSGAAVGPASPLPEIDVSFVNALHMYRDYDDTCGTDPLSANGQLLVYTREDIKRSCRLLLRFDFASLPPGTIVDNARLRLYAEEQYEYAENGFHVSRVAQAWNGEADWCQSGASGPWCELGGCFLAAGRATTAVPSRGDPGVNAVPYDEWITWDVTEIVRAIVEQGATDHGLCLWQEPLYGHGRNQSMHFSAAPGLIPQLLINGDNPLETAGEVVAWGYKVYGQCDVPAAANGYIAVAGGGPFSLALTPEGSVVGWGVNTQGQCDPPSPNGGFTAVSAGHNHALGLRADGTIAAWGEDLLGQCTVPSPNADFIAIAAGYYHSLGLKTDGTVVAWGRNVEGQCNVPVAATGIVSIYAGRNHGFALKADGSAVAWGADDYGQCDIPSPNSGWAKIAGGGGHSVGLRADGTVAAWGRNDYGQGETPDPASGFIDVSAGDYHSVALRADGSVLVWGRSTEGQLAVPVPNDGFASVSAGDYHTLGLLASTANHLIVTEPTAPGGDPAILATPNEMTVRWSYSGATLPRAWTVGLSYDRGQHYRQVVIVDDPAGTAREATLAVPPVSTDRARVRVQALDGDDTVLASGEIGWDLILVNGRRIFFDAPWGDEGGHTVRDIGAVLTWAPDPEADQYRIEIEESSASSCADWNWAGYVFADPVSGEPAPWFSIPADRLAEMPAARYHAKVYRSLDLAPQYVVWEDDFLLCRLDDFLPLEPGLEPVMLVHGWTADSDIWYGDDGECELIDELIAEDRRPWTFEYPNIDDPRLSGAGLGEAIAYALSLGEAEEVDLIAHSMGGLVSRCYLQGYAIDPRSTGETTYNYEGYRGDVRRFVTLATPHLGEGGAHIATLVGKFLFRGCPDAQFSASRDALDNNGALVPALAGLTLPTDVDYFFAAGSRADGDEYLNVLAGSQIWWHCHYVNDGAVSACSATGGFRPGHYTEMNYEGISEVAVRGYWLGHNEMARPGESYGDDGDRNEAAAQLLQDVSNFLTTGNLAGAVDASAATYDDWSTLDLDVVGRYYAFAKDGGRVGVGHTAGNAAKSGEIPIGGAEITVRDPGQVTRGGGLVHTGDAGGEASLRLPPGHYEVEIAADGYRTRTEQVHIPETQDNYYWSVDLEADGAAGLLRNPSLVLAGGALASPIPIVLVEASCEGAVEYQLSETELFPDEPWLPLSSPTTWTFTASEGPRPLFARFRDAAANVSAVVGDAVTVTAVTSGSISITADQSGLTVLVDGVRTSFTTPVMIGGLAPGNYDIAVAAPGCRVQPPLVVVQVEDAGTQAVEFTTVADTPPPAADAGTLGAGPFLSGLPLSWDLPTGWDPAAPLWFDLTVSTDSLQNDVVLSRRSVGGTEFDLDRALPDSQTYYFSLVSVGSRGVPQAESAEAVAYALDHTPPALAVLSPAAGDTLVPGGIAGLTAAAADWSGLADLVAQLSPDGGHSWPDTLWSGAWASYLDFTVPAYDLADSCLILVSVRDLAGNLAYATSDSFLVIHDGLTAAPGDTPGSLFRFSPLGANPLANGTRFQVEVAPGARAHVAVYDIRGRRVRVLLDGTVPGGRQEVAWDGRDGRGRQMAAGVYLLSLTSEGRMAARKATIVR